MYFPMRLRRFLWPGCEQGPRRAASQRPGRALLRLEPLEDRLAPAGVTGADVFLVKDMWAGADHGFPVNDGIPDSLTDVNGTLFFAANDGVSGLELWKSDGTAAGTVLVKDINPGSGNSYPSGLANISGTLFFTANDGTYGTELWKSDGTAAGTILVKDINPGNHPNGYPKSSSPDALTNVNGALFFVANDGSHGEELWKSDGTDAGTVLVDDINPGSGSFFPHYLTNANGTLFFNAYDPAHGYQLWKSDGTAAGTVLVKDFNSDDSPGDFTNVNGTLFFRADDGTNGWSLWKSDGTTAGTAIVSTVPQNPWRLADVNGTLFFMAYDVKSSSQGLWKSDGTADGTVLLKKGLLAWNITNVNGTAFFSGYTEKNGAELWKSDGTSRGTVLVKDIYPRSTTNWYTDYYSGRKYKVTRPNSSTPENLLNVNGTLFFVATDETAGREFWKSDGTATGTVRVKDINPGSANSNPASLTVSGGHLFFSADDGVHGRELWDPLVEAPPVASGSSRVADGIPLSRSVYPEQSIAAVLATAWLGHSPSSAEDDILIAAPNRFASRAAAPRTPLWTDREVVPPPTEDIDQVFVGVPTRQKPDRLGWPLDFDWHSDLLADLAETWQLR